MSKDSPFLLPDDDPVVIQFSGGRSSALMLRLLLDQYGGKLPENCYVLFQNTGKERWETLNFIHQIEDRWEVEVVWLEFRYNADAKGRKHKDYKNTYEVVDYITASRNGEPFEQLIDSRNFLPNPVSRICTAELKISTANRYMRRELGIKEWHNVKGLRADEEPRIRRAKPRPQEISLLYPLFDAGIDVDQVNDYWAHRSEFDLAIRSDEGNCDLCFLKGKAKIAQLIRERPGSAAWWARMETRVKARLGVDATRARWRSNMTYAHMIRLAESELDLPMPEPHDMSLDCNCTD